MGDNWISRVIVNAVSAPVANAVASAGTFAGGAVGGVGNAINGVGRGIENGIRYYGDGVKDYGNAIQDWTKAGGTRQGTASNPLGLSGTPISGKLAFTGGGKSKPAPSKSPQKTINGSTPQKQLPGPVAKKSTPAKAPATKPATSKALTAKPNGSKAASKPTSKGVRVSAESRPAKAMPKPRTSAPRESYGAGSTQASNPLGL